MTIINNLGIFNSFMTSSPSTGVSFRGVETGFPLQTNLLQNDGYSQDFYGIEFDNPNNITNMANSNPRVKAMMYQMQELMEE